MEIASIGQKIQWSFDDSEDHLECFRNNTFEAFVQAVNHKTKEYGVYAEYGQDYIPFNEATIINTEKNVNKNKATNQQASKG